MRSFRAAAAATCILLAAWCGTAAADASRKVDAFAVVIGVNDARLGQSRLRYADDDAVQYASLFGALGADAYLMTRADENTARVHPAMVARALPPTRDQLDRVVAEIARRVAEARGAGRQTAFYFVYAGHGELKNGQGRLGLAGGELSGADLVDRVLARVKADQSHVIVDACYASLLVNARGPGGHRRRVTGFTRLSLPALPDSVGLLLSTTSGRESHEWEGFQAGVFSHEVRSGLYGAADADGDGRVSYREIAAFVMHANAAIANERFRPDVFARPPRGGKDLVDLRPALRRRIEIEAAAQGHYILEDSNGVRVAEFHGASEPTTLVRPASPERLYLERGDGVELVLPESDVVDVASLEARPPRVATRGAAHEAFTRIFSLPFDRRTVERYPLVAPGAAAPVELSTAPAPRRSGRRAAMWIAYGIAASSLAAGGYLSYRAGGVRDGARPDDPQEAIAGRNQRITRLNTAAGILYGAAGGALLTGVVLMLWPEAPAAQLDVSGNSAVVGLSRSF